MTDVRFPVPTVHSLKCLTPDVAKVESSLMEISRICPTSPFSIAIYVPVSILKTATEWSGSTATAATEFPVGEKLNA